MIFQYDQALEMPTMNVYDDGLMQQYINAIKEDYKQGLADQKEFITKYGDFQSPLSKSVDWWNENVNEPIRGFVQQASKAGIDMRSPEFRAALSRLQNSMPYSEMQKQKQQAKYAEEYIQNRNALIRAGKYDPDFEKYLLNGKTLESWDPIKDGEWTRTSPEQLNELSAFAALSTNGLKDSFIKNENGYDHYGITRDRVQSAIGRNMLDYLNSNSGKYYLDLIAKQNGLDLSNNFDRQKAEQALLNAAIDRSGKVSDNIKVNEYDLLKHKHDYDQAEAEQDLENKKALEYYKKIILNNTNGVYNAPKGYSAQFTPIGDRVVNTPSSNAKITTTEGKDGQNKTTKTVNVPIEQYYRFKNNDMAKSELYYMSNGQLKKYSKFGYKSDRYKFYPVANDIIAGSDGYYYQRGTLAVGKKQATNVYMRMKKTYKKDSKK